MTKEIHASCNPHDAEMLTKIAEKYPVSVKLAPYSPNSATLENSPENIQVTFTELKENTIDYRFFGTMFQLLNENREPKPSTAATEVIVQPVETISQPRPVRMPRGASLWVNFLTFIHPQKDTLNPKY